jgi:hypothetical protein
MTCLVNQQQELMDNDELVSTIHWNKNHIDAFHILC